MLLCGLWMLNLEQPLPPIFKTLNILNTNCIYHSIPSTYLEILLSESSIYLLILQN